MATGRRWDKAVKEALGRWRPFSALASPAPAPLPPETILAPDPKPEDDTQAARLILALAEKRYEYEHARTRDIEAKAGPTLGLSSAILVLAARVLIDDAPCLVGREEVIYYSVVALGLFLLLVAGVFLLLTLRPATFIYVKLDDWVRYEETQRPTEEVRGLAEEIAGSYRNYTAANASINNRKVQFYTTALGLIALGVAVIVGAVAWAGCSITRLW